MQLYILNTEYDIIAYIDEAESVLWLKKFNDIGECEIYVPCDIEWLSVLRKGHYVYRYDDDMFCKIVDVQIDTDVENGDYIIATGTDMSNILSGRVVRWNTVYSGNVVRFIKRLIEDNVINPKDAQGKVIASRKIDNFVFDMTDVEMDAFTETIETTVNAEDVLQRIIATCKAFNYGFRTSLDVDTKTLNFRVFKGVNRADNTRDGYVEFSPTFGNIVSSKYRTEEKNYKNVAYVGYKDAAGETHLLSTYIGGSEPVGEDRREIYIDGTNTSRNMTFEELKQMYPNVRKVSSTVTVEGKTQIEATYYSGTIAVATSVQEVKEGEETEEKITVTDHTYLLLIRAIGQNLLAQKVATEEFTGSVDVSDSYRYKIDYDLGDIVKVVDDYGNEANAQVVETMESEDNDNGYVVEPRFQFHS